MLRSPVRGRLRLSLWFGPALALSLPLWSAAPLQADPARPSARQAAGPIEVSAKYGINFNGFDIGSLQYGGRLTGKSYVAESDVEISALLGAFKWKGVTRSAGTVAETGLKPSGYTFDFNGTSRSGAVRMGFDESGVTQLTAVPQAVEPDDFVPLAPQHLKSVVDPLTAIIGLTRAGSGGPCANKKLAVFDGKQRFDITLVQRRREAIAASGSEAAAGLVCAVRYTPIGGYRANADTQAFAESSGIEVTFRSVPRAGVWVPHRVVLPTLAGNVTIEAQRIDITGSGGAEIALVD